ncbi:hypothetical protein D3C87_1490160 [compost metagenome]
MVAIQKERPDRRNVDPHRTLAGAAATTQTAVDRLLDLGLEPRLGPALLATLPKPFAHEADTPLR